MNKHYYAHAPSMTYAISVYAKNKKEAKAHLRRWLGVKRLPSGSAVWKVGTKR